MCEIVYPDFAAREEVETLMDREDAREKLRKKLYADPELVLEAIGAEAWDLSKLEQIGKLVGQALLEYSGEKLMDAIAGYAIEYIENEVDEQFGE